MVYGWWQKLARKLQSIIRASKSEPAGQQQPARQQQPALTNLRMVYDLTREPKPNLGLPPNAIPGLSVIKELVRGLRYRSIDTLIGHTLELTSIERAPGEVSAFIRHHGIEVADLRDLSAGVFMKYGILDYEFNTVLTDIVPERQRVRFLKDLGLLLDKSDVDDSMFFDAGIGFLEEMVDETKENKLLFKIILDRQGERKVLSAPGPISNEWLNTAPNNYFPCEFTVRDACLTNCGSIWLNKHFYL